MIRNEKGDRTTTTQKWHLSWLAQIMSYKMAVVEEKKKLFSKGGIVHSHCLSYISCSYTTYDCIDVSVQVKHTQPTLGLKQ